MSKFKLTNEPTETPDVQQSQSTFELKTQQHQHTSAYKMSDSPDNNLKYNKQESSKTRFVLNTHSQQENNHDNNHKPREHNRDRNKMENKEAKNQERFNNQDNSNLNTQYKVVQTKKYMLSDQQKDKADYTIVENTIFQQFNYDNTRTVSELAKRWFESLKLLLKESNPASQIDFGTAMYHVQYIFRRPDFIKTNIDDIEQANLAQYIELCTMRDTDKYMRKDDQGMPEITRRRLLGLGKDKNIPKEYGLKLMEQLNKYGLHEEDLLIKGLVQCLGELSQENISDKELFITFNIMIENIYEKACLEKKYITFYVKLLLKLAFSDTYFNNASKNYDIKGLMSRFIYFAREQYIKLDRKSNVLFNKKFDEGRTNNLDNDIIDDILMIYMRDTLTYTLIRNEISKGRPSSQRFQPRPDESPAEKAQREINAQVHFQGCIQFIGELYKHDKEKLILQSISNFIKQLIKQCFKELVNGDEALLKEYPDNKRFKDSNERSNYYKSVVELFKKQFKNIDWENKKPSQNILNYATELIKNINEQYYLECHKNNSKDNDDFLTWELIQDVLKAYPREHIEGFIRYKIDDYIVGYKPTNQSNSQETRKDKNDNKNNNEKKNKQNKRNEIEEINIEVVPEFSTEQLLEEWRDTNFVSILELVLNTKSTEIQNNFSKHKEKILKFAEGVIKHKHQHMLFKELGQFCKKFISDEGERKSFLVSVLKCLLHKAESLELNDGVMRQTYRYITHIYQESYADLINHIQDFKMDRISDDKITLYCQNIVRFTVYISFSSTLIDQEDMEDEPKQKIKDLVEQFKFYDVGSIPEVIDASKYEQINYLNETEAAVFCDHIPNLFDKNAIDSLAKVFDMKNHTMQTAGQHLKVLAGNQDIPTGLSKFFESINFGCGVQVFKTLKLMNQEKLINGQPTKNKLLIYNFEYLISNVANNGNVTIEQNQKLISEYIEHFKSVYAGLFKDNQPIHVAACVMDKIYIYFKQDEKGYLEALKSVMPILNIESVNKVFNKFAEKAKNFGSFKQVGTYLKSLDSK